MWSKKNLSEMTKKAQVVSMYFDPLKSHYKVEWSQDQRKFLSKSVPLKKKDLTAIKRKCTIETCVKL